ncbi:MarR family winged helix-turn-helix transcriptional regulator [Nocardia sp. NPDC057668]|uniref:MarR family winged helix-turn-helix transcriptional regulator n=1 Tax=Nocardia sp. NPDC057668 TaxID=3346202 RepID=UPI00366DAB85
MKPIGFWLNRADRAITAYFDRRLAAFGLTRLAWQALNVIRAEPEATETRIHAELEANADRETRLAALDLILTAGWAERTGAGLSLTAFGRDRHDEVTAAVAGFRADSMTGITPDEYRTAVTVLERMTLNLEPLVGGNE